MARGASASHHHTTSAIAAVHPKASVRENFLLAAGLNSSSPSATAALTMITLATRDPALVLPRSGGPKAAIVNPTTPRTTVVADQRILIAR